MHPQRIQALHRIFLPIQAQQGEINATEVWALWSLVCSIAPPELGFPWYKSISLGIPPALCRRGGRQVVKPMG